MDPSNFTQRKLPWIYEPSGEKVMSIIGFTILFKSRYLLVISKVTLLNSEISPQSTSTAPSSRACNGIKPSSFHSFSSVQLLTLLFCTLQH